MTTSFLRIGSQQPAGIRFNRAHARRAFVTIGQCHVRDARRLVMRRTRSAPSKNLGYQTGCLTHSTGYMVPRANRHHPGFMIRIIPNQRNGEENRCITDDFYPTLLFYNARRGAKHRRSHRRGTSDGNG